MWKQTSLPQQNWQTILFDKKIFRKNDTKKYMHFDKSSLKNSNLQQQKNSRNATKQTAQLCRKAT